jgi:hypothetical protein
LRKPPLSTKEIFYLHGVVDGILGIVVVVFTLLEDSRSSIKLELDLSSQSTLEVDDPQGFFFTNGNGFNLKLYI